MLKITFCKTHEAAQAALAEGATPIECSFGTHGSVVDHLVMDHHGEHSFRQGVAIRAYSELFGVLRDAFLHGTAHFAVTGAADADACFAIAALIGELPHPSRVAEFSKAPPSVQATWTQDITHLATLVNQMDTDPSSLSLCQTDEGCQILLWEQMASSVQDATAFYAGVDRWRSVLGRRPKALLAAVREEEARREELARLANVYEQLPHVTVVQSEVWGFDVWYRKYTPVIVALTHNGNITIGVKDTATAEHLFGPGGLKVIFPVLSPPGWGGRESIGGSPRSMQMTRDDAITAARRIQEAILPE